MGKWVCMAKDSGVERDSARFGDRYIKPRRAY